MTAVTITGPGGNIPLTNLFGSFIGAQQFATPDALDAAFPAGTYTVNATGAGNGTVNIGSTADVPTPRFNNLTALASMNPEQAFTLTFAPFTGAGASDAISVRIHTGDGTNEFHAPDFCKNIELPNTATSVVIPANTFRVGQVLRGEITFSRMSFDTNSIPNTALSGGVSKTTDFDLGEGGQEPNPPTWTTVTKNPDGTLTYTITGDIGLNLGIEASETLAGSWTQLTTALLTTGSFQFTVNPGTPKFRFYRARVL